MYKDDYLVHFEIADPRLFNVMRDHGPFRLRQERNRFKMLVRSIVGQQLSVMAARTIFQRFESALDGPITAEAVSRRDVSTLRQYGISQKKAEYVLDLAMKVADREIDLAKIGRLSDEEIIAQLVSVRGIGRWTAQMFLIFALGRKNVFPHEDLGVRSALKTMYALSELPTREFTLEVASRWTPYASIGSWYCWRMIDAPRESKSRQKS